MKIYANLKAAEEMGIDRAFAINARRRFLTESLFRFNAEIRDFMEVVRRVEPSSESLFFATEMAVEMTEKKFKIVEELGKIKNMTTNPKGQITDDMIERARDYPVERLIEFTRKKSVAWCHCDTNPSLCHMNRINKVWCPVCNKYFDSIGVLMDRDGMSFIDAVKELS